MRSGKRRIAASATIEGGEGCIGGSACMGLHIQHRPRSMHDEREGLLGLIVVVTRVLERCL